ncbi:MAG: hydroxymethylglutaryl-CoA lyase [Chloroflexota bacterium]|nr:hydroxymethylglutaryl-CoA lyase [Chloroflexota bacterium]
MGLPAAVTLIDVGLRDGLQNEGVDVPTEGKLRLAQALVDAGVRELEVTSFVRPDLVPRMADAEAVIAGLPKRDDVTYVALVANERGYERAARAGVKHVIFVLAATDAFNERNVRRPVARSIDDLAGLCRRGEQDGVSVRAAIAVSFGCPFSGPVAPESVLDVAERCVAAGARDLDIADTIGVADPRQVSELFTLLRERLGPDVRFTAHFHDTRGMAVVDVWAALGVGIDRFDASIAGLGGCPFAPGATGNVATEDVAHLLARVGVRTGLDHDGLFRAADVAEVLVGRPSAGRVKKAERAAAALA